MKTKNLFLFILTISYSLLTYSQSYYPNGQFESIGNNLEYLSPTGMAIDNDGSVLVSCLRIGQFGNAIKAISRFDEQRKFISSFDLIVPWLVNTERIAVDNLSNIYVVTSDNSVQKYSSSGIFIKSWGGYGTSAGMFNGPSAIGVDNNNNIFIADSYNNRIQKFDSEGNYLTQWGQQGILGSGGLVWPNGLALDSEGNVFVVSNGYVQKFDNNGNFILKVYSLDNSTFTGGTFRGLKGGITSDKTNNLFISNGDRIEIFNLNGIYINSFDYPSGTNIQLVPSNQGLLYVSDRSSVKIYAPCSSITSTQIVSQPSSKNICSGDVANLLVSATGVNLSYLWSNGETTTGIFTNTSGIYTVTVTGGCGSVVSTAASVSVNPITNIVTEPTSQTICAPAQAVMSVSATGANLTYKWSNGLTTRSFNTSTQANYTVTVSGFCGIDISTTAGLVVRAQTSITKQPVSVTLCTGTSTTIGVTARGYALSYRWNTGQNTSSISVVTPGIYLVTVSGSCGNKISQPATVSNKFTPPSPIFTTSLTTVCAWSGISVSVTNPIDGYRNYSSVWTYPSGSSAGQGGGVYSGYGFPLILGSVSGTLGLKYTDNITGCAKSTNYSIKVLSVPGSILAGVKGPSAVCEGSIVTVTATGGAKNYQLTAPWGFTSSLFGSSFGFAPISTGLFTVTGFAATGCSKNITFPLTVNLITRELGNGDCQNQLICANNFATILPPITGSGLTYLWNTGETSSYITTNSAGCYQATISGVCGTPVVSKKVQIFVLPVLTVPSGFQTVPGLCFEFEQNQAGRQESNSLQESNGSEDLITIYPNPGQRETTIYMNSELGAIGTIEIYNNLGSYIRRIESIGGNAFPSGQLPPGAYVAKLGDLHKKFIIY